MSSEYDLVIIGATAAGLHAASLAARLKARVALVEQTQTVEIAGTWQRVLGEITRSTQRLHHTHQIGIYGQGRGERSLDWPQTTEWITTLMADQQTWTAPAVLAAAGVDYLAASGEFCRKPHPGFIVEGRLLRSRAYLLALNPASILPPILGLDQMPYLTPTTLWPAHPQDVVILGDAAVAIELAQTLVHLGTQVTLIVNQPTLLPRVDREAALLLQAILEAQGVRVLTQTAVSQVQRLEDKIWVQAGNQAIATDALLLAFDPSLDSALDKLNLAAMGVTIPCSVNARCQTINPRVYLCGHPGGQADRAAFAQYDATIAVHHALGVGQAVLPDRSLPQVVWTHPEIAWVGLTELQARQQFGRDVVVLHQDFKPLPKAQMRGEATGFCKLIARRNGRLLGAHLVGPDASELIGPIALTLQQNLTLSALAHQPFPAGSLSEILAKTAVEWEFSRPLRQQNWLMRWLQACRFRFK
jgi:pyruvate/2-oxoglutarate dehydrogenase complex dihydrolipoamide dehydrogenase (E3) component